jgi:transcriptional regulator with XRE-family HTH domain
LQTNGRTINMPVMSTIKLSGEKLRDARVAKHFTQRMLSIEADVSHETINRLERKTRSQNVYPLTARKLADALGVEVSDLADEEQED